MLFNLYLKILNCCIKMFNVDIVCKLVFMINNLVLIK